ncbi:DUF5455 family protein [uncultured Halovibrio sp.]|uniref:DUF5455 family protein n=1 Tax=uncultured Halovibrio sp. TaxID=985049 RepID=UPI0025E66E6C|nr:DUF5455 family protein [uncultured Halovibrio sp.]
MPAPAIVGVPWLASILSSLFAGLVAFFAKFLSKKLAMVAAIIAAVVAVTASFIGTLEGLLAALDLTFPGDGSWGLFVPGNLTDCVSMYLTARLAKWFYYWQVTFLQYKLF